MVRGRQHPPESVAPIGPLVVAKGLRGHGTSALVVRDAAALARAEGRAELERTTGLRPHAAQRFASTFPRLGGAPSPDGE